MNRPPVAYGLFFLLLLGFAVLFAFTPLGGTDGVETVTRSFTEPIRLLRVLLLDIAPSNLVVIAFVGCVLIESFSLARRLPDAATRIFEQATMLVLSGVLCGQYLKLAALAPSIPNPSTAAILGAFGLAAVGFASILTIKVRRFLAMRSEIMQQLDAAQGECAEPPGALGRRKGWGRIAIAIGASAALAVLIVHVNTPTLPSAHEGTKTASVENTSTAPATQRRTTAEPQPVRVQQETIERITVGAQAKHGNGPQGETGDATLPSGLRFTWASGGQGYEPAFVKRARDGSYYWRGQRVPTNAPILTAFALDGPAVRPNGENALLFFHRDVLASLHGALAGQLANAAQSSVAVDRDGRDVVLRITGTGKSPQSIVVSPANL